MIYRFVLTIIYCISLQSLSFANDPVIVSENEYVYGGSKIGYYLGEKDNWDYKSVISNLDKFNSFHSNLHSGVPTTAVSWVYFELQNPESIDIWMNTGSSRLNEIKVYCLDGNNQVVDSIISGINIGRDYRMKGSYKFVLPILKSSQKSGKFLVGYCAHNGMNEMFICFGTKDQLADEAQAGDAYSLMYCGICLLLIFYNLILAWSLREKVYLLYSLNIIIIFLSTTFAVHFPFIEIIIGEVWAQDYFAAWFWLLPFFMALFTSEFFNLKESSFFWYKMLWGCVGLFVLNSCTMLFLPLNIPTGMAMVLMTVFYSLCALTGYSQIKKKHPLAVLYFVSWMIVLVGMVLYFMVAQLSIFYSEIIYYCNYLTASTEALLFSIALGRRYQLIAEKEKETAALLVKKNESLVLANKSLDSFNYHVSHDLKTILVNTSSLNQMMKKYTIKGKTEKVLAISDRLEAVAKKGEETVKGFLSLAEAGKIRDKEQKLIVFSDSISELIESNGLKMIMINYDVIEFESLYFNPVAFNSVFLNLLTNSNKYCLQNPVINISLKIIGDNVQITYSDNGIGVDLEKYGDLLFSPFRRVKNDLNQEGSGVGLYLVKRIIDEYEGSIIPFSTSGEGLSFVINLPKELLYN